MKHCVVCQAWNISSARHQCIL